jgi:ABC-type spermidine/putrescine transport system permease subunit I
MIGNVIESQFFKVNGYPTAAVLSFILMASSWPGVLLHPPHTGTEELV